MFGPERTATGRPVTSVESRLPVAGSRPFVSDSTGALPGSERATSANAFDGTASTIRSVAFEACFPGRDCVDARQVDVTQVARVAAGLADCTRLLGVAARERDVVAAVGEETRERRPPRARADDGDPHPRFTKSMATGVPSSS